MQNKIQETSMPIPVVRSRNINKRIYNIHQQDNIVYACVERGESSRLLKRLFKERLNRPCVEKHAFVTSDDAKVFYNLLKQVYLYQNGYMLADDMPKGDDCFVESGDAETIKKLSLKSIIHLQHKINAVPLSKLEVQPCLHSVRVDNFVWILALIPSNDHNNEFYTNPIFEILGFNSDAEAEKYNSLQHLLYRNIDMSEAIRQNQKHIDCMNKMCQLLQQTKQKQGKVHE